MKIVRENFFDRIRNRLSPDRAAVLVVAVEKAAVRSEISARTIREAAALLDHYRGHARRAIGAYRQWQADRAVAEVLQALRDQEGRLLQEQARAHASLYLDAMRDYRDLRRLATPLRPDADDERNPSHADQADDASDKTNSALAAAAGLLR